MWSAAATTPLWLYRSCRLHTAKAVSPSEADSATALQMGRRTSNGPPHFKWAAAPLRDAICILESHWFR